jgi:pyruvate/2-oxoglutarate dehydrogenase complex dihydrolipoamide acyltransferase (E2) component
VDGKQAVQFLVAVKNAVENPVFELWGAAGKKSK